MDDLAGVMLMYGIAGRLRQGYRRGTVGKKGNGKQNKAERRRNHRRSNGRSHRGRNRSKAYNLPDTPGGEAQLSVKVLPENVDISGVKWTSKNEEVISVDSTGKVTAVKEGKAGITASLGKMNATCTITVKNAQAETQPATVQAAAAGYDLNQELAGVEAQCQTVMDELNSGNMTQMDMNRAAGRCYTIWDDELNVLWDRLTPLLTEEEHSNYLAEQRAWIQEKEAAIEEAGLMWEGGSARPLAEYTAGEEWTRKRCYVLAGYLGSKIGQTVDMSPLNNDSSY